MNRWTALKELPGYFEGIGVKLSELVSLEDTGTATWKITADAGPSRVLASPCAARRWRS